MNLEQIKKERRELLDHLREQAEANRMTNLEIAEKCGWKETTVRRMLNGDFGPKLDHLILLCDAIGYKVEMTKKI